LDRLLEDDYLYISENCDTVTSLGMDNIPYTVSGIKTIDETCYYGIIDRRVQKIEDTYSNITIDIRESKDIYFDSNNVSYRIRFLKDMDKINTSYFVAGEKPTQDNQIAVAEIFAKNNNLDIGDTFQIDDKDYIISGFVLFPDYSLTLLSQELILDNTSQTVALVTDEEFEALDAKVSFTGAGDFLHDYSDDQFTSDVIDTYRDIDELNFITSIQLTINNMRSGAIYAELAGGKAQSIVLSLLISSIALMIVGIMVSRVLQKQRGPIGLLKAMGYSNNEITRPYIFFIAILSLPMILLGYFLGLKMAQPFMEIYLDFYLLPYQPIVQSLGVVIVSVVVPFLFIVLLSYIIVKSLLNKKPVVLLNPEVSKDSNYITKKASKYLKKYKITTKLQHLLLYRSMVKFVLFLVGMFYAAFLILLTFSMNGIFDRMLYDYYENTDHNYIAYCDYTTDCIVPDLAEKVIDLPSIVVNDNDAQIIGLDLNNSLHHLFDKRGNDITSELENGVIITKSIQLTRNYQIGDILIVELPNEELELEVVGISEEYTGNKIYINREVLSNSLQDNGEYYNAIYTVNEPNKDDYLVVISLEKIIEQADSMQGFMQAFVLIMVLVSISIGAIVIYIITVITIEDNFYNISLFKVMGYNNKEINKMILGGYSLYGIGIFIITIPIAMISFKVLEYYFAQFYDLLFPMQYAWWHGIVAIAIYLLIFSIGALQATNKLKKVSLQEAMKMYQV
jgi:putative ABC transport system permease protein